MGTVVAMHAFFHFHDSLCYLLKHFSSKPRISMNDNDVEHPLHHWLGNSS